MGRVWEGFGEVLGRVWEGFGEGLGRVWAGFKQGWVKVWGGFGGRFGIEAVLGQIRHGNYFFFLQPGF